MATLNLNFEGLENFQPIASNYPGVTFSENALALVTTATGGAGKFNPGSLTGNTVLAYAKGSSLTIDLGSLEPQGIAS